MHISKFKHIVWDWNGTILDDVDACVASINQMLAVRALPTISRSQYLEVFDFPVKKYYLDLGFDLKHEDWDAVAREFHRHYAEYSQSSELRHDTLLALKKLHSLQIPMSILSACEISILNRMLEQHHIRQYFQKVYGLDNLYASSKLEQGQRLMQELKLSPADILLIGDTNHDYEVAQELGINCILLAGGHQAQPRLNSPTILPSAKSLLKSSS